MNQTSPFQDFPAYVEKSSSKSKFIVIFIIVLLVLVGTLAGLYFLGAQSKKSTVNTLPVPTEAIAPTKEPSPTATASASVTTTLSVKPTTKLTPATTPAKKTSDRSSLAVAVLNGSGVPGAAKEISAVLNELGYTIKIIGNADNFSYKNITIKIKKAKSSFLTQLKKDVASKASASATITTSVEDEISADAEVIVGK